MVAARLMSRARRVALASLAGLALAAGAVHGAAALAGGGLGASEAPAQPPRGGYPPDPPGTPSTKQWLFDVRVDKGHVAIERVRSVTLKNPQPTARVMGRYAIELWVGTELLDRIRFNVPLGADLPREDDGRPFRRPSFDKINTRFTVQMADQPRAAHARLVDRATGGEARFLWPPRGGVLEPIAPPPRASAPPRDAGPPPGDGGPDGGAPPARDAGRDGGPARPDAGRTASPQRTGAATGPASVQR